MKKKGKPPELPVLGGIWGRISDGHRAPTLDEARERLGGPWVGGPDVGEAVTVRAPIGRRRGVVVHASPTERDVWIGGGRLQRVAVADVERGPFGDEAELAAVADDARVFASLREGQRVAYLERAGDAGEGTLVEKLRYGALVGLEDGRVIAVSFRRLAPADDEAPS